MRVRFLGLLLAWLWVCGPAAAQPLRRVIAGAGSTAPHVVVRDADEPVFSFFAYTPSVTGGVRVALGDVSGDGVPDLVTGVGPGAGPHVKVFDGVTGAEIRSFFAFSVGFTGGVLVAAGDVDGDGRDDVIVGAGAGGGPHVKVFSGATGAEIRNFLAFTPSFSGGVSVAAGDVNGDGLADLVLGTGAGDGWVKILNGASLALIDEFEPYGSAFNGGVFVAAGDLDGDGRAEQVVGPDENPNGGPRVLVFDGQSGAAVADFYAFDPAFAGGVRVGAGDVDGDGLADLILAPGPGHAPTVRRLRGYDQSPLGDFEAFSPSFTGGVFVGGIPTPETGATLGGAAAALGLALVARRRGCGTLGPFARSTHGTSRAP